MGSLSENLIAQNEIVADYINKTEKESVNKNEEKAGEQSFQERNKNIIKIWKQVTHSGEEETLSEGSTHMTLGKKNGEIEGLNCDDQRHLKIRR
jgi:uncharacterized protein YaaR (DUF327 family)